MSFSENVQNAINNAILNYIDKISNKYKINKEDLLKLWNSTDTSEK